MKRNNILYVVFVLFLISCNKKQNRIQANQTKYETTELIIGLDSLKRLSYAYTQILDSLNTSAELVSFHSDGKIDYTKSNCLEIKGNDLFYYSPYNIPKYKIGINRFVVFKSSDSVNNQFSNINTIKLSKYNFNENGIIINYKEKVYSKGIVEETIFLDTIIKSRKGNKTIIRTLNTLVNLDNLLINRIDEIKKITNRQQVNTSSSQ